MHWMQFIIELVDRLAWPIVVMSCAVVLKTPLLQLLPLAKKVKYKELEIEFGEALEEASKDAREAFPEFDNDKKLSLIESANSLPNAAVLEAWRGVELAAEKMIQTANVNVDLNVNTRYKVMEKTLLQEGLIDQKRGKLFNELRRLRNKVAHAKNYQVGSAEAVHYIELCYKLMALLSSKQIDEVQS
ncbi:hypothetical protein OE749_02445 [Aestuariibacter sp. AA17]|uniref:DUF4145 domain-containing protein n=1 Tax=Fluctibacter corallii TaxID=2984329 RepID=A0ABT3A4E0_9ALTE|nr:hypothetical protein [Aestuariibacter sp. AA17]MCV2883557.1 hypothetical protein [Aestuariibacter sp. AA17]